MILIPASFPNLRTVVKLIPGKLDTWVFISADSIFQCPKVIFFYKAAFMCSLDYLGRSLWNANEKLSLALIFLGLQNKYQGFYVWSCENGNKTLILLITLPKGHKRECSETCTWRVDCFSVTWELILLHSLHRNLSRKEKFKNLMYMQTLGRN